MSTCVNNLRDNQTLLINRPNVYLSVDQSYEKPKIISIHPNSNRNSDRYKKLDFHERNSLILTENTPHAYLNSQQSMDTNNRNKIIIVNPSNDSRLNRSHQKHRYEINLLKDLLSLGIKKNRIEKALAATGYQNSFDAINWLMKHAKDPILDETLISSRDCILLLCPVGILESQITQFFHSVKQKIGCNEAHYNNLLPFMKLTPFFKIPDSRMIDLHKAFDKFFKNSNELLVKLTKMNKINLDLHSSHQMILLYPDVDSENAIREILASFNRTAAKYSKYLYFDI